ncbi:type II secretion system minor pseudopilin GspI [Alteromonas lipotrueiana]|uniref:type II secretion system minor pseudopilin GspI n=1 Tax=Alteromonas lipotrueiana TaxID=2803815 RepID=UPI001FEC78E2|nr:type II secretion system minor pseudopilin GspI [Alteromonas lipotrueiana]|tara:strand:- start:51 stop:431 length:381 start_codon:yes stop_codon:yes gene_type:complete
MSTLRLQTGMTLLEVMVALFIFAMAGTAVMKAATEHLSSVGDIEEVTFATWVASNRLNQIKLTSKWPPENNEKGTIEMADRTWYWQQNVKKTNDKGLRQIEVKVGLDESYQSSVTSVVSYVSQPEV